MIVCPTLDDLRALLDGDTPPESTLTLRAHLTGCDACQTALDRLADDPTLDAWMADAGSGGADAARRIVRERAGAGPDAIGPFAIEAELGRGGVGVVYRARDRVMGRLVALKLLRTDLIDEPSRLRFVQEARAASKVEHDHVVRVYATGDPDDPRPYLAMEFVAGPSLAEWIRGRGRLDPREAAGLVAQAADGLAAAHAAGVVHRDVKPANILIESRTGRAKVGDFGLARLVDEAAGLTRDGVVAGTPAYLSPEQARGDRDVGPLADVYALGVTLYECLAGEPPFRGTPARVVRQILDDEPTPPRVLNERVPRDLQTIVLKVMDKEASRRYDGAAAFAADLRCWLAGEPIHARPIGPAGRLWRRARRRPVVSALAASLALTVAAGLVGVTWQWRRAEANAQRANDQLDRTIAAIDTYFTQVSESRLLNVSNLQPLRKELIESARDSYEALIRDRPDDPNLRVILARTRARLAGVTAAIGSYDEALELYGLALPEFDALLAALPDEERAREGRIAALVGKAAIELNGSRLDACRATCARLLEVCEADRRQHPDETLPLEGLYAAYHDLGGVASNLGEPPEAIIAEYERALAVNRELLAIRPDHALYLRNTSRTALMLALPTLAAGRTAEGQALFDEGLAATRRLVAEHPESLDYRFALASYEANRGSLAFAGSFSQTGPDASARLDEARDAMARALDLIRGLVRDNPRLELNRADLVGYLAVAAAVEFTSGRHEAIPALTAEGQEIFHGLRGANGFRLAKFAMVGLLITTARAADQAGRVGEALARLDEARAVIDDLTDRERAAQADLTTWLGTIAWERSNILLGAGRPDEAAAEVARAIDVVPDDLRRLLELGRDLRDPAATIDPGRALAVVPLVDKKVNTLPQPGFNYLIFAKIYALAAGAAEPAAVPKLEDRAALCLEKAARLGYLGDRSRRDRIAADRVLAPFLNRPVVAEAWGPGGSADPAGKK